MNRDPFYQQIIEHLGKKLDPDIFEQCVTDLLSGTYPGLVPIPGGQDAGMDGAIADGKGEPFPLITTTQDSVITNLTKSLQSYKKNRRRRLAVLATSQKLTPKEIQNLYDKAVELGFTLVNVHVREDIANRLYHSPKWCKELLNLSGRPSSLSIFPKSERLLLNNHLIGRDEAIKWLHESQGDCLIIGQPGSGKSFLLHCYAMEGNGLFVVDEDREAIANGIRSQEPSVLIVDDAQIHTPLLAELKQIRQELGTEFSILASCWIGDKSIVQDCMNLASSKTLELDLLTRAQIVEVIHDAGLGGPDGLIHEIVNQSNGRPGLAATLAHLSLQGEVKNVVLGDILSNSIKRYFEPKLGSSVIDVLAAFSVGGNMGMKMQDIAQVSQLPLVGVHRMVTELGMGGVLWERNEYLSVHPATLRHTLVRDIFLNQSFSLPIQEYINRSPSLDQTTRTLIGACHQGAKIGHGLIKNLLESGLSAEAWVEYAWLGATEATWILENHPELALEIAHPALVYIPKLVIPLLFEKAVCDDRQLHNATNHPLKLIQDWINEALPGGDEVIKRRETLIALAVDWLLQGKNEKPGFLALQSAYHPICMTMTPDPGAGNSIAIRQAYILPEEMIAIQDIWPVVMRALKEVNEIQWEQLEEIINYWAYPESHIQNLPQSTQDLMRSFAQHVLTDAISLEPNRQAVLRWAKQLAVNAQFDIQIQISPEFETLYPIETRRERFNLTEKQKNQMTRLVRKWSERSPVEIAMKVAGIEREAHILNIHWPRRTPYVCTELSKIVTSPKSWAAAFIDAKCQADLVLPFVKNSAEAEQENWVELVYKCLHRQDLKGVAITIVLTDPYAPDNLVEDVFEHLSDFSSLIETHCARGEISEEILKKLLQHQDTEIASAAALGEWYANNQKGVRRSLEKEWRSAVIRSRDEHFVASALTVDPVLAYEWLLSIFTESALRTYKLHRPIKIAVQSLEPKAKYQLLNEIPAKYEFDELIISLIGEDLDLYHALLQNNRLQQFHLAPLIWQDGEIWIEKAKMALEQGYSAEEIAYATYQYPLKAVSWGNEPNYLREWVTKFEKLSSSTESRIQEIGEIGKRFITYKLKESLRREHNEEVYGHRDS